VLGPGPQVGAQFVTVVGGVGAKASQLFSASARTWPVSALAACSAACARVVSS